MLRLGLESSIKKEKKLSWLFASIQIKNKSFFWWVLLGGNIDSGKKAKRQKGKVSVREMRQSKCGSSIRSKEKNKSLKEEKIGSQKKKIPSLSPSSKPFFFFLPLFCIIRSEADLLHVLALDFLLFISFSQTNFHSDFRSSHTCNCSSE